MALPKLTEMGLLPPGVHEATMEQVKQRFGRCQRTDRRPNLMASLEKYCQQLQAARLSREILIDGSFVTNKDEPGDVDLIVVLKPESPMPGTRLLPPAFYNLMSNRMARRLYGFDVLTAHEGTVAFEQHVEFFSLVRQNAETTKGLVRVSL